MIQMGKKYFKSLSRAFRYFKLNIGIPFIQTLFYQKLMQFLMLEIFFKKLVLLPQ